MKKMIVLGLMAIGIAAGAYASNTASANSHAYILTPLNLTNNSSLEFGRIATNDTACTVTVSPATGGNDGTRTTAGGSCWLDPAAPVFHDSDWTVTGEPGYTFTVTLTSTGATNDLTAATSCAGDTVLEAHDWTGVGNPPPVTTFNGANGDSGFIGGFNTGGGTTGLSIGATIDVAANQCPGDYNGTFTLQVTYP